MAERTRCINRLGWHLYELDPSWDPTPRSPTYYVHVDGFIERDRS